MKETTVKQPAFTKEELANLLIELADSKYWPAIMAYYNGLEEVAMQGLRSVDAFKNPTDMARNQGFISALPFLSRYIEEEKKNREEKLKENKK